LYKFNAIIAICVLAGQIGFEDSGVGYKRYAHGAPAVALAFSPRLAASGVLPDIRNSLKVIEYPSIKNLYVPGHRHLPKVFSRRIADGQSLQSFKIDIAARSVVSSCLGGYRSLALHDQERLVKLFGKLGQSLIERGPLR
jgi:hypothetical protein